MNTEARNSKRSCGAANPVPAPRPRARRPRPRIRHTTAFLWRSRRTHSRRRGGTTHPRGTIRHPDVWSNLRATHLTANARAPGGDYGSHPRTEPPSRSAPWSCSFEEMSKCTIRCGCLDASPTPGFRQKFGALSRARRAVPAARGLRFLPREATTCTSGVR